MTTDLGVSAILVKDAAPRDTVLVPIRAACVLAVVAVLEDAGRWRPRP